MNKYEFKVTIAFCNLPHYTTIVAAINGYQATQEALNEHRVKTGCGLNEMYDSGASKFQQLSWRKVNE